MIDHLSTSLVDWSRAQFALTAIYHWIFVPLTLGLSFIVAIMESFYVRTGNEEWKRLTKFWMTLFGINFAIGIATGIILEFEFGTNWSNYSWFVGDIFGAPLAIEGILAFFLESTFVAVMFFGWNKVSKKFHLTSTWLVAIGASISAMWILIANSWMQNPVGMIFNPDTARNEMESFRAVVFNPVAVDKFFHTVSSGCLLASIFVLGVSSWFLLKKREEWMAKKSMLISSVFGLASALIVAFTGDSSARTLATVQPMKFAAMEAHYYGTDDAPLTAIGVLKNSGKKIGDKEIMDFAFRIKIPGFLSVLTGGSNKAFVPGIYDMVNGGLDSTRQVMTVIDKMHRGELARTALEDYKRATMVRDTQQMRVLKYDYFKDPAFLKDNFKYFGYGYLDKPSDAIPDVPLSFYSFHLMVVLGFFFIAVCIVSLVLVLKDYISKYRWFLWIAIISVPLAYIASEAGWVLAEVGRQPWIIQDLMPVKTAVSQISTGSVLTTFILFAILFTSLLAVEISIMVKQIKTGPKH
jgi:cytochrome bd ubiquinol oxidase subunit I